MNASRLLSKFSWLGTPPRPVSGDSQPFGNFSSHASFPLLSWDVYAKKDFVWNPCLFVQQCIGFCRTRDFETRMATEREHSVCQDSGVFHIFIQISPNRENVLSIVNVIVWRRVIRENSSLPLAVRVLKSRVLKLPNDIARLLYFVLECKSGRDTVWSLNRTQRLVLLPRDKRVNKS